jgi:hypothetical protein
VLAGSRLAIEPKRKSAASRAGSRSGTKPSLSTPRTAGDREALGFRPVAGRVRSAETTAPPGIAEASTGVLPLPTSTSHIEHFCFMATSACWPTESKSFTLSKRLPPFSPTAGRLMLRLPSRSTRVSCAGPRETCSSPPARGLRRQSVPRFCSYRLTAVKSPAIGDLQGYPSAPRSATCATARRRRGETRVAGKAWRPLRQI